MKKRRLNGWQRLGIIASVLWFLIAGVAWFLISLPDSDPYAEYGGQEIEGLPPNSYVTPINADHAGPPPGAIAEPVSSNAEQLFDKVMQSEHTSPPPPAAIQGPSVTTDTDTALRLVGRVTDPPNGVDLSAGLVATLSPSTPEELSNLAEVWLRYSPQYREKVLHEMSPEVKHKLRVYFEQSGYIALPPKSNDAQTLHHVSASWLERHYVVKASLGAGLVGTVPIPLTWLGVYGLIWLVRWVRRGFADSAVDSEITASIPVPKEQQ